MAMRTGVLVVLAAAVPLFAQEQPVQDSPLVAAAKRAKASASTGKPAMVITNETLKRNAAKAHVTTTAHQPSLVIAAGSKHEAKPAKRVVAKKRPAELSPNPPHVAKPVAPAVVPPRPPA